MCAYSLHQTLNCQYDGAHNAAFVQLPIGHAAGSLLAANTSSIADQPAIIRGQLVLNQPAGEYLQFKHVYA